MVTGRPLFCGSSDQDQLVKIFKVMGTPSRSEWPAMVDLPEYKNVETYPRYEGKKLKAMLPRLSKSGLDLIERMLQADPQKRISAKEAMRHPYFAVRARSAALARSLLAAIALGASLLTRSLSWHRLSFPFSRTSKVRRLPCKLAPAASGRSHAGPRASSERATLCSLVAAPSSARSSIPYSRRIALSRLSSPHFEPTRALWPFSLSIAG